MRICRMAGLKFDRCQNLIHPATSSVQAIKETAAVCLSNASWFLQRSYDRVDICISMYTELSANPPQNRWNIFLIQLKRYQLNCFINTARLYIVLLIQYITELDRILCIYYVFYLYYNAIN